MTTLDLFRSSLGEWREAALRAAQLKSDLAHAEADAYSRHAPVPGNVSMVRAVVKSACADVQLQYDEAQIEADYQYHLVLHLRGRDDSRPEQTRLDEAA